MRACVVFLCLSLVCACGANDAEPDSGSDASVDGSLDAAVDDAATGDAENDDAASDAATEDVPSGVALTVRRAGAGEGTVEWGAEVCGAGCSTRTTHHAQDALVTLTAKPTNGTDSYFVGFEGGACSGILRTCTVTMSQAREVVARFEPQPANMVFVTPDEHPLDLGSADAYDDLCNEAAEDAGLNNATNDGFVALVSSAAADARTRLGAARGFVRMDGLAFADALSTFFAIDVQMYYPVVHDVNGVELPQHTAFVTGTEYAGDVNPDRSCENWTTTSGNAVGGVTHSHVVISWTLLRCDATARVFCMGNTHTTPVSPVPVAGKTIYVTSERYVPGATSPDAHCAAYKPAGAGAVHAVIGRPGMTGLIGLDADTTYVRVDGVRVGTGAEYLARDWTSGVWQSEAGAYGSFAYWTGLAMAAATDATTCTGWTSTSGQAQTGITAISSGAFRHYLADCTLSRSLLCVEE